MCSKTPTDSKIIIAISGIKNSGKTTLIESILPFIIQKGYKVAVIKHDGHSFSADVPGTDTYRHLQAGACGTAVYDGDKYMLVRKQSVDENELFHHFPEADLIIVEGGKYSRWPKIEVVRAGNSTAPACDVSTLIAIATDLPLEINNVETVPLSKPDAVADFVLQYINGLRGVNNA